MDGVDLDNNGSVSSDVFGGTEKTSICQKGGEL